MVKITENCIECDACIDECPVEAIVDSDDNPDGKEWYYVYQDKCVECVGYYDEPACAQACPSDGAFVWSELSEKVSEARPDGDVVDENVVDD